MSTKENSIFYSNTLSRDYSNNGLSGLQNLGNTCYMNTAIHCISNINVLTDYFITDKYLEDFNEDVVEHHLVKEWCRLLKGIWDENCTIAPNSFYKIVSILAHRDGLSFSGYQQNDLQEFIIFFIDTMHKALKQDVIINIVGDVKNETDNLAVNAMKTWKNFFKNDYSIFTELFYGQYIMQIKCSNNNCNYVSHIYDPFCYLTLPISVEDNNQKDPISLIECFDNFTSDQILDSDNEWKCEKCNIFQKAVNKYTFWKLPKILIISLKRFDKNIQKNDRLVNYNIENLDLKKYCHCYEKNTVYDLYAVGCHKGNTQNGHYFSLCKNQNDKWYCYNDEQVIEMGDPSLIITNFAYCLFYKKKNI